MRSRYSWIISFVVLTLGLGCGAAGLALLVKDVTAGYYLLAASALPIMIAAVFAALAFRAGIKGQ